MSSAAAASALEATPQGERLRRMTISHATDLWLGELDGSERTVDTYRRLLDKLAGEYPHIDVEELTTTRLRRFLDAQSRRADGARKSPATIAQNVSIVCGFYDWLTGEGLVRANPTRRNGLRIITRPRQQRPDENDAVVTVTDAGVARLLEAANRSGQWNRRLAVHVLAYLGPRRRAVARARIGDYDPEARTLAFREKGGKTIRKPVPHALADLIDAAIAAGVYHDRMTQSFCQDAYLIPGNAPQRRPGERDDRIIWRLVREVAVDAGVTTHVHALRAAFAVRYLTQNPGHAVALQKLMGHARPETTNVYLRRLDRQQAMETVRDLDWSQGSEEGPSPTMAVATAVQARPGPSSGVDPRDTTARPQIAAETMESLRGTEKEGFEPSFDAAPGAERAGTERAAAEPLTDALEARIRAARDREHELS